MLATVRSFRAIPRRSREGAGRPSSWYTGSVLAVPLAREISRAPTPIRVSEGVAVALLLVLEGVAVWAVARIWRERGSLAARIIWTVVTLVPVLGLIAHAVWRDPPPPNGPTDRPPGTSWDDLGSGR